MTGYDADTMTTPGADSAEPPAESAALSARQAAEVCGVSERTIRNWIAAGRLPATRTGVSFRIDKKDLALLVRARPMPAPAAERSAESAASSAEEARTTADLPPSDSTRSAESSGADSSVPAIVEALRLVRYQQDQIAQLAGQVGFLQAQLEATREQLRLQAPPPAPAPDEHAPAASPDFHQASPATWQDNQDERQGERQDATPQRRAWWKFW